MPARDFIALDELTPKFVETFLKAYDLNRNNLPVEINALQFLTRYPTRHERAFQLHARLEAMVVSEIKALRKQLELPSLGDSRGLMDPAHLLAEEFSQGNTSLEMWSAVYHRFFTRFPQSIKDLCEAANVNKRRFYRRRDDGLAALAQMLVMAETEARQETRGVQLYEKLPRPTYAVLEEREDLIQELRVMIDDPHGPRMISLEGVAGSGKTAVARQLVADLTDVGLVSEIAWVDLSAPNKHVTRQNALTTQGTHTVSDVIESIVQQFEFAEVLGGLPPAYQVSRLRDALFDSMYLVVLDGIETLQDPAELLELLYPLTIRVVFVITSRHSLGDVPGVLVRTLPGLSSRTMRKMLQEAFNRNQIVCEIDDTQARDLYEFTEGRPGAVLLIAHYLRMYALQELLDLLETRLPDAMLDDLAGWFEPLLMALSSDARQLLVTLCCVVEDGEQREWLHFVSDLSQERFARAEEALASSYFLMRHATLTSYNQIRMPPLLRAYIKSQLLRLRDKPDLSMQDIKTRTPWLLRCIIRLRNVLQAARIQIETMDRTILLDGQKLNRYYLLIEVSRLWDNLNPLVLELILALHPLPIHNGNWKRWLPEMEFAVELLLEQERFAKAAEVMNCLAEIYFHDGRWEAVTNTCEDVIALSEQHGLPVSMARGAYTAVDASHYLGLHDKAPQYLEQIITSPVVLRAEGDDAGVTSAWICLTRALLYRVQGRIADAYAQTQEAERLLIEIGSPDIHTLGSVYQYQGLMLWAMGRYKEAETQLQYALQVFIDLDDIFTQSFVEGNLGLLNWSMGKLVESMAYIQGSIQVASMVQAEWHLTAQTGNLALLLLYKHDLTGALVKVDEQLHNATQLGIPHEIDRATINRGAILYHLSRYSDALSALEKGRRIKGLSPNGRACLLLYLARVYARRIRLTEAWECIEEVKVLAESSDSLPLQIAVLRTMAEVTSDEANARGWLRDALVLAEDTDRDFDRAACLLSLARLESAEARQVYWDAGAALLAGMDADDWLERKSPERPPQLPTLI